MDFENGGSAGINLKSRVRLGRGAKYKISPHKENRAEDLFYENISVYDKYVVLKQHYILQYRKNMRNMWVHLL